MITWVKQQTYQWLRWSEKYTKTDMVYLARSGFWGNMGTLTVTSFSFLLYIAFAHLLSKDAYGTYQYLLSLSAILGAFTLTGMNGSVTQAVARGYEGVFKRAIRFQLLWNIIPLLGSTVFSAYYFHNGNPTIGTGLLLIGIGTPLINTFNTYGAYLAGKRDFRRGFLYNFVTNVFYYGALIGVAFYYNAPIPLLIANLVSQLIGYFIVFRMTIHVYKPNDADDPSALSYGSHLSLMNLLGTIIGQMDSVLAFHFLGPTDLAIYNFSTAIPERLAGLFKFIPAAAIPKFAVKTKKEISESIMQKALLAILAGGIIAIVYAIFAHLFFSIFFSTYMAAVPYSQVYAIVIAFAIGSVFPAALTAQRQTKQLYIFNTVVPVLQLALQFGGVLLFGLWGLIFAKILYWFIYGVFSWILLLF